VRLLELTQTESGGLTCRVSTVGTQPAARAFETTAQADEPIEFSKPMSLSFDSVDNLNVDVPADDPEPIAEQMRYGLNFIRVNNTDSEALEAATQPAALDADFTALGIEAFRQFTSADGLWSNVSTPEGGFDFTDSDNMLLSTTHIPIMTLFSYQLADGTTPADEILGDTTPETSMTAEQEEYLGAIVEQYKNTVTYWEIGNEMAHWELSRPGEFPIEAQALWLKSVAEVITEHDPDAQIVLPGLISITEDNVDDWLEPVIQTAGSEWFDVVNYHYYSSWLHYTADRAGLQALIDEYDLQDKPVWLTETGSSADATNTTRTNYPNSPTEQAADVFRRSLLAYAAGDAFVGWHTYIGNDVSDNDFRYYGIVNADLTKQPAYYTTQLLTSTVAQFRSIENEGGFVYRVVGNDETTRYVAWSATASSWTVPTGMTQMTSVVPNNDGTFTWTSVVPGQTISLSDIPVLLE
jgi:hypothetical protein